MLKRTFDILASLIGLILAGPFLLILAVWIKLDSDGPVFYRGVRVGRHGVPFRIFKFRSMVENAATIGPTSTADEDPRITRPGRLIRKCKLDELSQLLNVLIGDMSLVGPRPEVQKFVDKYTEQEKPILDARPGITDWASIWNADEGAVLAGSDDPDEAYERLLRPTKLKLQLEYVRDHSVLTDIQIILYTILKVIRRDWVPKRLRKYPYPLPAGGAEGEAAPDKPDASASA